MTHWVSAYVGREWDAQDNHCWAFCRHVWAAHFGLDVPEVAVAGDDPRAAMRAFSGHPEYGRWIAAETPAEGDAVVMAQGRHPCHVGIWIAAGGVLHSVQGTGAIYTPAARLRDIGYRITGYWRRADACAPR